MRHNRWLSVGTSLVLALAVALPASAQERKAKLKPGEFNPDHASVEMFAAMEAGQLEVKIIPKDSTEARVFFKNKTDKPLNVELPKAFASVPVLAQLGAGGGGLGGGGLAGGGGAGGGGNQGAGGGMGGGGMGGGGMGGGGGGFFNVVPERVGEIKVATVCLEHGKKEPRAAIPYEIRRIETFKSDPAVAEMLILFSQGKLNQKAAQAAAWHICDKMSWEQLAAKRIEHANGLKEPWFTPAELNLGMQIANSAKQAAARNKVEVSPGEKSAAN